MVAMTTTLERYSSNGNAVTYALSGTTFQKPRLLIQKRKPSSPNGVIQQDSFTVIYGTEDSATDPIPERISFEVTVRRPITGSTTDVDAALAVVRDVIAGDEFGELVTASALLGD